MGIPIQISSILKKIPETLQWLTASEIPFFHLDPKRPPLASWCIILLISGWCSSLSWILAISTAASFFNTDMESKLISQIPLFVLTLFVFIIILYILSVYGSQTERESIRYYFASKLILLLFSAVFIASYFLHSGLYFNSMREHRVIVLILGVPWEITGSIFQFLILEESLIILFLLSLLNQPIHINMDRVGYNGDAYIEFYLTTWWRIYRLGLYLIISIGIGVIISAVLRFEGVEFELIGVNLLLMFLTLVPALLLMYIKMQYSVRQAKDWW